MTTQRMVELLEIEHECILRNSHGDCDRNCADCDLVQEDGELHEMYTDVISLLKENGEETEFSIDYYQPTCKLCGFRPFAGYIPTLEWMKEKGFRFCPHCGRKVKWDENP